MRSILRLAAGFFSSSRKINTLLIDFLSSFVKESWPKSASLSIGIRLGQPESASDERWWKYISIINESNTKGHAHSEPPASHHRSAFSFTAEELTGASSTAAAGEFESSWLWESQNVRMALIPQCWFKLPGLFFLQREKRKIAENLVLYQQHCGQHREDERERDGNGGWLRGSGWIETRWDTECSRWADFQSSVSPSCWRRLIGWQTPTIEADMDNTGAFLLSWF